MRTSLNCFTCDPEGYLRHWLVAGPHRAPYTGPSGSDDDMRLAAVDPTIVEPPHVSTPKPSLFAWELANCYAGASECPRASEWARGSIQVTQVLT